LARAGTPSAAASSRRASRRGGRGSSVAVRAGVGLGPPAKNATSTASVGVPAGSDAVPVSGPSPLMVGAGAAAVVATAAGVKYLFDKPSRAYEETTVGAEYDSWTEDGVLEYYWGEHIHLGYYTDEERAKGYLKKDFKQAKFDFVDEMLEWSGLEGKPARVLDVGCGIGGTSRYLARKFGAGTEVTGITLSPKQQGRATALAAEQETPNASFRVMDALNMEFEDNQFDLVWACESGEHMPDKKAYVEEMARVLKPGGTMVVATWCQRETPPEFSAEEQSDLTFLYEEWAHPYFVSIEEYVRLMEGTGKLQSCGSDNWADNTIDSWRHSIWVGVFDPWIVVFKGPFIWYKTVREIVTLERMHRAFDRGLMTYGMMKAKKKAAPIVPEESSEESSVGATKVRRRPGVRRFALRRTDKRKQALASAATETVTVDA